VVCLSDQTGEIWLKGMVPGAFNGMLTITKTGEAEFEGLLEKEVKAEAAPVVEETPATEVAPEQSAPVEEVQAQEQKTE